MFSTSAAAGSPMGRPARSPEGQAPADLLPISRRQRLAREAFWHLLQGTCVDIVGPRLSGRSTLVEQVAGLCAETGASALTVTGVSDALPYDALRAALAKEGAGAQSPPVPTASLIQRLGELSPAILLVDDAHLIDAASWSALRLAHRTFGTSVLVTTPRLGSRVVRSTAGFARRHARIALEPLDGDDVHELLQARLGGQISPSLVSRILIKSGGIAGIVCAIIHAAVAAGRVRQGDGFWYDLPELWDDTMASAYDAVLADLADEEVDGLELLAAIGTVDVGAAAQLVGFELLERLESAGRVRLFAPNGSPLIAVNPPGLSDFFARSRSSVRRLRILDTIAAHRGPEAGPSGAQPLVDFFSAGRVAADDQLPFVARMFAEAGRTQSQLALAKWTSTPDVPTALRVLVLGLSQSSDRSGLQRIVETTTLDGCPPRQELTFRYLRARWAMQAGQPLGEVEAAFAEGCTDAFPFRGAHTAMQTGFRMERIGIVEDDVAELERLRTADGANGELPRIVLTYALLLGGRPERALELLAEEFSATPDLLPAHAAVARGLALCASGRYEEAADWSTRHLDDAMSQGERLALAGHAYSAVLAESALGRLDRAFSIAKLVISLDVSSSCMLFDTDKALLNLTAVVALRTGREAAAQSFAARARMLTGGSDALPFHADEFYEAARQLHRGSAANAAATQRRLAESLDSRGYRYAADFATMLSLTSEFDPEVAARFRDRGSALGGERFVAYLDGQAALDREDADDLLSAGRRLRSLGARDEALRLLTHARRLLRAAGRMVEAEAAKAEISALLETEGSAESTLGHSRIELTSRELELVRLVAAGLTNAEISAQLHISVRTVDTHLRNIRKKAGAGSREELALLASGS